MNEYELCNNKRNNIPEKDSKPYQETPNNYPSIFPPKCQNNTHPESTSLNNYLACTFHPHNNYFAAG
jgi:hypothetical protein